jgi:hypothetical protein
MIAVSLDSKKDVLLDFNVACHQASLKSVLQDGFHSRCQSISRGNFSLAQLREDVCGSRFFSSIHFSHRDKAAGMAAFSFIRRAFRVASRAFLAR